MLLPLPHSYSEAELWLVLPPNRREMAQDYHAQERLKVGLRSGQALVGRLIGMQDTYFPEAVQVPEGWEVGCTCERRMPCAHVGALLWAWRKAPERFQHYEGFRDLFLDRSEDPLWRWAAGAPFPWDQVETMPWYARAAEGPVQAFFASKGPWTARHQQLRLAVRWAHDSWWDRSEWASSLADALKDLADHTPLDRRVEEAILWIHTGAREPRVDLWPLLAQTPIQPSIGAELLAQLWALASRHGLKPRPSYRLRACALLRYLSLWYRLLGNPQDIPPLWGEWAWADPQGIAEADFWAAEGDLDAALSALHKHVPSPATASYEWRIRHQAWSLPESIEAPIPPPA